MKIYYILSILVLVLFISCSEDPPSTAVDLKEDEPKETKTTYLREPVEIIASTGEDYPQSLIDVGFPVLPNTEVTSVGNTDITNGTVVMQMETTKSMDAIRSFYDEQMKAKNWETKKMNIFQGADAAFSYRSPEYTARILVINDKIQDFRKIAVTLNERVKVEDYE